MPEKVKGYSMGKDKIKTKTLKKERNPWHAIKGKGLLNAVQKPKIKEVQKRKKET